MQISTEWDMFCQVYILVDWAWNQKLNFWWKFINFSFVWQLKVLVTRWSLYRNVWRYIAKDSTMLLSYAYQQCFKKIQSI